MNGKVESPFSLDIDFGEALARFAQTKPEEVEAPKGKKVKSAKTSKPLRIPDALPFQEPAKDHKGAENS